jgi:hypothetical protein
MSRFLLLKYFYPLIYDIPNEVQSIKNTLFALGCQLLFSASIASSINLSALPHGPTSSSPAVQPLSGSTHQALQNTNQCPGNGSSSRLSISFDNPLMALRMSV